MAVISVHQHIEHHVHMWVGQQVSVGHAQFSVTEMPGDQEVLLTGQENHGQLSDHIANVGTAHIMGGRVAKAAHIWSQRLQEEADHFT